MGNAGPTTRASSKGRGFGVNAGVPRGQGAQTWQRAAAEPQQVDAAEQRASGRGRPWGALLVTAATCRGRALSLKRLIPAAPEPVLCQTRGLMRLGPGSADGG